MRAALCGLLLVAGGCGVMNPPPAEQPPTEEDGNGTAVVRLDFVRVWEPGAERDPQRLERDETRKPTDVGMVERGPTWPVMRRIVLMTPAPADPQKTLQEYADKLGQDVAKVPGATVQGVEKPHQGKIGPIVSVTYLTAGRTGTIQATVTTLDGHHPSADAILEFLEYRRGKEVAMARHNLSERKGPALVVYVREIKK
jgi:hypothetical protein